MKAYEKVEYWEVISGNRKLGKAKIRILIELATIMDNFAGILQNPLKDVFPRATGKCIICHLSSVKRGLMGMSFPFTL